MAFLPISAIVTTTGDAWTDLMSGPSVVTQVICANTTVGDARVSVRLQKGSKTGVLVPNAILPEGGSYRFRVGAISLASGDKLQAKSSGSVDWTVSGTTV